MGNRRAQKRKSRFTELESNKVSGDGGGDGGGGSQRAFCRWQSTFAHAGGGGFGGDGRGEKT
jgi:hypothetical protein